MTTHRIHYRIAALALLFHLVTFSFGQTAKTPPQPPDSVVKSVSDFNAMIDFFKKVEIYDELTMRKDYVLKSSYPKSAMVWAEINEKQKEYLWAKYYHMFCELKLGHVYEVIKLGNELLADELFRTDPKVLEVVNSLRTVYLSTEQYNEVLNLYDDYERLAELHKVKLNKSQYLDDQSIAMLHYRLKNYRLAIEYFKNPSGLLEPEGTTLSRSSAMNNIGLCFKALGEWDSALYYFDRAIDILKTGKLQDSHEVSYGPYFQKVIESNKAEYYILIKDYDKALGYYMAEYKSSLSFNESHITANAAYNIARVYYLKRQPVKALDYLNISLKVANEAGNLQQLINDYQLISRCESALGRLDESDSSLAIMQSLMDSVDRARSNRNFLNASSQFEISKMKSSLQSSLLTVQMQRSRNLVLVVGLVVAGLLAVALLLFYMSSLRSSRIIARQKQKVQEALEQKEILLKEVHHRVKNNLQVITSILDLQKAQVKDPRFDNMVSAAKEQIHSMSLVHQMLYKKDTFAQIDLRDYIGQLIQYLQDSRRNFKVRIDLDSVSVHTNVDRAITLGLIVTELIINSFKHAFLKTEAGVIKIGLRASNDGYLSIEYFDNGPGLPEDYESRKSDQLGMRLLKALSEEIKGYMVIQPGPNFKLSISFFNE